MKALIRQMIADSMEMEYAPTYGITRNGYEIDFVIKHQSGQRQAIQVCADPSDPATLAREVRALTDTEPNSTLLLLTSFAEDEIEESGRCIHMMPAWKWFLTPQREVDAS